MDTHDLNMEVKHIFSKSVKLEEETGGVLSRWAKTAFESCGLWSSHVKGKPLMEMAIEEGQTRCLKDEDKTVQKNTTKGGIDTSYEDKSKLVKVYEDKRMICGWRQGNDEVYQLVGRVKEVWAELDVLKPSTSDPKVNQERRDQDAIFSLLMDEICELVQHACDVCEKNKKSTRWKGGTSCKKGRSRKLSKVWFMMRKSWKKDSEFGYLSDNMGLRMIKDVVQQVVRGECSYSAYMGNSVEDNTIMRGLETKGVDDPITK